MKTVTRMITTAAPPDVMMNATVQAMRQVGGQIEGVSPGTFKITQGNANVQFAFLANMAANVTVQTMLGGYTITTYINMSPNVWFWVCAVAGFFFVIPWIGNVLYFFIDPTQQYTQALNFVQNILGINPMPGL